MIRPILITGAARSGTSMTAGIFHLCGAFGGEMSGPTQFNKRGMFENATIRNEIVKPFLKGVGADPMGQNPLPDIELMKKEPVEDWRNHIESVFLSQGYTEGPWFYKGAKMCLMWPIWRAAFPDAFWLIVRRPDEGIVESCMNTSFMRAYRDPAGWHGWVDEHKLRFEEMRKSGCDMREVWPGDYVDGDYSKMKAIVEEAGLRWNAGAIGNFVDPTFWRYRHGKSD